MCVLLNSCLLRLRAALICLDNILDKDEDIGDDDEETDDIEEKTKSSSKPKKSLFGPGKKSKKFNGKKSDKAEWFLNEALDIVYDPHGTGKALKRRTILARSSNGNVRVEDVVFGYSKSGEEGISELAWTSPTTKYIIEAYDSC